MLSHLLPRPDEILRLYFACAQLSIICIALDIRNQLFFLVFKLHSFPVQLSLRSLK